MSVAVGVVVAVWIYRLNGEGDIDRLLKGNRSAIYGAVAGIFGSLLGFVIATLSIIVALGSLERLKVVRESKQYPVLWKTLQAAIRALGFGTAAALAALVFDRDRDPQHGVFVVLAFATTLVTLRLARAIWILERVLGLAVQPSLRRKSGE
ncbi:MAG: hypothetical protein H0U53_06135 [Actinobacteria bacterium]|nr:hypothetical protein [Actinomycetota bacterium]